MDIWSYAEEGFNKEDIVTNGNRFLTGNGYMGIRGTMDEWGRQEMAAINLAGVYDQNGDNWREPVNAPDPLFTKIKVNGKTVALGETEPLYHRQSVNFQKGLHSRNTIFEGCTIESERFASMAHPHLLVSRIDLTFDDAARVELLTGINTDIWDINGPHLYNHKFSEGKTIKASAFTGELKIPVAVAQNIMCDFPYVEKQETKSSGIFRNIVFDADPGKDFTIVLTSAIYTGLDVSDPGDRAEDLCVKASSDGYAFNKAAHEFSWEEIWDRSAVKLEGNDEAARALNASLYHLHSIAPRHAKAYSIPARGLSGQTYKGAIFWDSEMFLFPFFAHTEPELAKTLLRYRIETLPGALDKAAEYGYRGAFYAWESQEGGKEGCTNYNVVDVFTGRPVRTYFRDKQIHISGDIVYAMWKYYEITGDTSLFCEGAAEVILQCARFYLSRAHSRLDIDKVELLDVIGPDEYHERVNNNAFTNQMAVFCLECAIGLEKILPAADPGYFEQLIKKLGFEEDFKLIQKMLPKLRSDFGKTFSGCEKDATVIEQFDGYFSLEDCTLDDVKSRLLDKREYWGCNHGVAANTQIIKQADVIAMMALFPALFNEDKIENNWKYYEPRTEHGSSLSATMYALTACRFSRPDLAWEHFIKSASIDLTGGGKHWAGKIYIGGTHPAANGGAWMIAVLGFAGLSVAGGEIKLNPHLPEQITSLSFPINIKGKHHKITVTHDGWEIL